MSDLRYLSLTLNGGFLLLGRLLLARFGDVMGVLLYWLGFLILFMQLLILAGKAVYRFISWIAAPNEEPPEDNP